ncbi:ATP-binding protein [Pedobacter glucosidilyticus]|uniref:ATP-binding protein n=1 Tax=Pedobacter glucosidilyticus TaxID=1122941 RepID=UPI0026F21BA1|nr:ATP-binding protein [Pedobacter glucosidilyticus]
MADHISKSTYSISEVSIRGFKSIEDLKVTIMPGLNILIGKNGAGKSNFLEGLNSILHSIYRGIIGFKNGSLVFNAIEDYSISYTIDRLSAKAATSTVDDINEAYQQKLLLNKEVIFDSTDIEAKTFNFKGKNIRSGGNLRLVLQRLGMRFILPKYVRFDYPADIKGIAIPSSLNITLEADDFWDYDVDSTLLYKSYSKLEDSFFASIDDEDDDDLQNKWNHALSNLNAENIISQMELDQEVIDNLRLFTPIKGLRFNKNISLYRNDSHLIVDNIRLDFLVNDNWLPWSQLSDGTKRLFFIITDVTLNKGGITLVEEPELGVHPHQLSLLMQFLKEQSEDQQIIISTHSPKALDILTSEELDRIMIARYEKGQGTQISRMITEQREKATAYMNEVGYLSDYWLLSDLEE